jgi:hypothetical protein
MHPTAFGARIAGISTFEVRPAAADGQAVRQHMREQHGSLHLGCHVLSGCCSTCDVGVSLLVSLLAGRSDTANLEMCATVAWGVLADSLGVGERVGCARAPHAYGYPDIGYSALPD